MAKASKKSDSTFLIAGGAAAALIAAVLFWPKKAAADTGGKPPPPPPVKKSGITISTKMSGDGSNVGALAGLNYVLPTFTLPDASVLPLGHTAIFMQAYNGKQEPIFDSNTFIADADALAVKDTLDQLIAAKALDSYFVSPYLDQILAAMASGGAVLIWTATRSADNKTGILQKWWLTDWSKTKGTVLPMARKKTAAPSKGMSGGEMALLALGAVTVGYFVFKPKDAYAATPPGPKDEPPPPTGKICADGSAPVGGTCMKQCPGGVSVPEAAACPSVPGPTPTSLVKPTVTMIASAPPLPILSLPYLPGVVSTLPAAPPIPGWPPWFLGFPLYSPTVDPADPNPNKVTIDQGDVLVFLQGFSTIGKPVFDGTAYPSVVLKGVDAALVGTNLDTLMDPTKPNLSSYFAPGVIEQLETPGGFVLVWSTDSQGQPLAWWLMNWMK